MEISDRDRDAIVALLARHAALDRLSTDELERRVELVMRAETRAGAERALAGLPPLAPETVAARSVRGRGHGERDRPQPGWRPTAERFRDPTSGRVMRVWLAADGRRHYVADA